MRSAAEYKGRRRRLPQRHSSQARRSRACRRQRRERQDRELVQRQPRDRARRSSASPTPTPSRWSTWCRSDCRTYRAQVPAAISMEVLNRPLDLDPRSVDGRAGDAGDRHRPCGSGDLPVPALGVRDHHSGAGGAGLADRHLRGDVRVRLLDQQHDAARADVVGRLRGRRRHRHAREHRAPHRRRHAAVRGRAQGLARDRLHHHLDHVLADRGVHSGAADGRHRRARVPRIRGDDRGRHPHFRLRLADADADAVRARAARPSRRREAESSCCGCSRRCSRAGCRATSGRSTRCSSLQVHRAAGHLRHAGRHRASSTTSFPKGFFPTEDTGFISGIDRGRVRHFVPGDGRAAATRSPRSSEADKAVDYVNSTVGAGGPNPTLNQGRMFIALKPQDRARRKRDRRDPAPARDRQHRPGHGRRIFQPLQNINITGRISQEPNSSTRCNRATPRRFTGRAGDARQDRQDRGSARRQQRPLHQESADDDRGRPREGGGLRHYRRPDPPGMFNAFGTRQVATIYTPTNDYQVILESQPDSRPIRRSCRSIFVKTNARATAARRVPAPA